MSGGHVRLREMIGELAKLDGMAQLTAEEAAPLVEAALKATAAAGVSPEGQPWAPRKKDGGRAMVNAAAHVSARAVGSVVKVALDGVDVFHHYSKSTPRHVIPTSSALTGTVKAALLEGARRAIRKLLPSAGTP